MTGSVRNYNALCEAWDALQAAPTEAAKDRAFIGMVSAAAACDPHALRSPSISEWTRQRVETYRACCATGWRRAAA